MQYLLDVLLPVLLYSFGIILLVVLIILGIRCIKVLDKVDSMVDDMSRKARSLDGLFDAIEKTTDGINCVYDKVGKTAIGFISKIFRKKKCKEDED